MTPENFTYWLQGFFEISNSNKITEKQVQIIKDHLDLVFDKKTPSRNGEKPLLKSLDPNLLKPNGSSASVCSGVNNSRHIAVYC